MSWFKRWRKKKLMKNIRANMTFLGFSVTDLSDQEIEEAVVQMGHVMGRVGLTAYAAGSAMRLFLEGCKECEGE